MNNRGWIAAAARSMVFLMQLGFSILLPVVGCLTAAWYLQEKSGCGGWVWPVAIVLGLAMGASSFTEFARYMQKEARIRPLTDWENPSTQRDTNGSRQGTDQQKTEEITSPEGDRK